MWLPKKFVSLHNSNSTQAMVFNIYETEPLTEGGGKSGNTIKIIENDASYAQE